MIVNGFSIGESGAGKTEATKQCLQYLAECAGSETCVEQKILLANPILEAFGNAKTIRNNNSSRFGKYIEVFFDKKYKICGARNSNYLLEKVRVVKQALGERNYHIFFQLCLGASVQHRREFGLGHPSEFRYLSQSGCLEITGVNDAEQFTALEKAMRVLEISEKESHEIFQTIAAILHLGNLEFIDIGDRMCELKQSESLMYTAKLLQVTEGELKNALTTTVLKIRGRDNTAVSLSALEASNNRDALSKFIYDRQFDWLVSRINSSVATCIQKSKLLSVGVLDIFGFGK